MASHFRTILQTTKAPFGITHADKVLCIGSCFTEHIGQRLLDAKIDTIINPFGITYNPVSIGTQLGQLLSGEPYTLAALAQYNDRYFSWQHHGHFDDANPDIVLQRINEQLAIGHAQLRTCTRLLITLGTAQVFTLADGHIVNNCHKVPANRFTESRLTLAQSIRAIAPYLEEIIALRPEIKIILTVSPVRHLRGGMVENQRSKAVLTLTADYFEQKYPNIVHYFPANELLLDDLRDYRFYAADMIHPSAQAVDYIFGHFAEVYFSAATQAVISDILKLNAAAAHRPFRVDTPAHQDFVRAQLKQLDAFEAQTGLLLHDVRRVFEAQREGW